MNKLLRAARTRAGIVVSTVGLVMVGGGVAAAAVIGSPEPEEASQVSTTTQPETTAPAPVEAVRPAQVPVAPPVVDAPAATVEDVTEPENQAPAASDDTAPPVVDPESIGTTGEDGRYTPAPPRQNPGEPPVASGGRLTPAEPLPGEPGYVAP